MANMAYCRFTNTLADLRDCLEHMDEELSPAEDMAREKLVAICVEIAENYGGYD